MFVLQLHIFMLTKYLKMNSRPWNKHCMTGIKLTLNDLKTVLRASTTLFSEGEIIKGNITSKWHSSACDMFWIPILVLRAGFKQANHNEVSWPISAGQSQWNSLKVALSDLDPRKGSWSEEWHWPLSSKILTMSTLRQNSCEEVNEIILCVQN